MSRHTTWWRTISKRPRPALRARRALASDLASWIELSKRRRALALFNERRGVDWERQAMEQNLPINRTGLSLHQRCRNYISRHRLGRGDITWSSSREVADLAELSWNAFAKATNMPHNAAHRALITDSLSFPLTAAFALRQTRGLSAAGQTVSLLVLGAERDSELAGLSKWFELLKSLHNVEGKSVRHGRIVFVGPGVPADLHAITHRLEDGNGLTLELTYACGPFHQPKVQELIARHSSFHLALAYNSGLAEHVSSWAPTLRILFRSGIPLAFTSYHIHEAMLDARTLRWRFAAHLICAAKRNPFASLLPHLDEIFPGRVYRANSFITVCSAR